MVFRGAMFKAAEVLMYGPGATPPFRNSPTNNGAGVVSMKEAQAK